MLALAVVLLAVILAAEFAMGAALVWLQWREGRARADARQDVAKRARLAPVVQLHPHRRRRAS